MLAVASCALVLIVDRAAGERNGAGADATRRGIAFLTEEVPAWPQQNRCFSCHNNGDGARTLLTARRRGWDVPDAALAETFGWLLNPEGWETTNGDPDYSDRRLINVQFAGALTALSRVDESASGPLDDAAVVIASLQVPDGSWAFEAEGTIGSPVGYGRPLMTVAARDVLISADRERFAGQIAAADAWLTAAAPKTVLDSAAVLWGLAGADDAMAQASIAQRLDLIRQSQTGLGGWGPYRIGAPEPFDTAIVILALRQLPATDELERMIAGGREFLMETQLSDGSWPATTRPAGAESYPQKISTSAWATLALIETEAPAGSND